MVAPADAPSAPPTPRRHGLVDGTGARLLLVPPAALLAIGCLIPLGGLFLAAMAEYGPLGFLVEPFRSELFVRASVRTVAVAAATTAFAYVVGLVYALAMALASARLAKVLLAILIVSFWISLLVRTYGWVLLLQPRGALDAVLALVGVQGHHGLYHTLAGLVPAMAHVLLPFMVLPIYTALQGIDPTQLRAARSLGAGEGLVLRSVVLPAVRSGSLAGITLVFVLSLGFYITPAFLGGPADQLVAIVVGLEFGRLRNVAGASAMGGVLLLTVLVVYFVADRLLRISEQWGEL
jgi:putative spermidine/putrescine transport system permease protein